jgi:predicted ribosome quality control (RQC) complex YloA/Tae2 family protein
LSRKEFTSFDVAAVTRELGEVISDSRVSNVYQLAPRTVVIKLHKASFPPFGLVLEAGRRLHLTSYALEKPSTPPAFCMALRKYLRDAWLTSVKQYGFERIVTFHFKSKEGRIQLVLELFGDGNLILVNDGGVILQALSYRRMRDRSILRGEAYLFPPASGHNPFEITISELREGLRTLGNVEVVRAAARFLGVGGVYSEEILLRTGIGKTKPCSALSDADADAVFEALQGLLSQVKSGTLEPNVVLDEEGSFVDIVPLKLVRYEGLKHQVYPTFNEALDEFYARVGTIEKATAGLEVGTLQREADRLKRIIESQEKTMAEADAKAKQNKRIGDTIYAHNVELQALLDRFLAEEQAGKDRKATASEVLTDKKAGLRSASLFESFDARSLSISVSADGLAFSLALHRSLFENAAEYYEHGKQAKQKMAGAADALDESRRKLAEGEAKLKEAEASETARPAEALEELAKRKVKSKEWFEKFRWFLSSDGFLVVSGKDAVSNEVLIKKHAEAWDVAFHSDVVGAPFVVVKTEGKEPTEQVLREAAEFAAAFSRGWREGFGSIDVYWVKPEQLTKKGPSGEYVPHGAFVVNGKRNWQRNTPLKTAIGFTDKEGEISFIGGPVDAVKAKTGTYLVIAPGDMSGKELLKHVLGALATKASEAARGKVSKASVEEIREFIPYGTGRIQKD